MRIAIITDAWSPQVNGVVRTLQETVLRLVADGYEVEVIAPDAFATLPCPTYPEIRLALFARRRLRRRLAAFAPHFVHIATEGPLGLAARRACLAWGWSFTTAFHTRFADYAAARTGIGEQHFWRYLRWFHRASTAVMVSTESLAQELNRHGITRTHLWSRGVDLAQFRPGLAPLPELADLPRPILLNVGRIAVEKNLEAFLALDTPGTKVIVGDGPARQELAARYPDVRFTGSLSGQRLAQAYASADLFVFPSRTDTFGLVLIEALASGLPVAAYPVSGPADVLRGGGHVSCLDDDLAQAVTQALALDRSQCRSFAEKFGWGASSRQFLAGLTPCRGGAHLAEAA